MPVYADFPLTSQESALINLGIQPPTAVGGWTTRFDIMKRAGGAPFLSLYAASGYQAGQSGITVINSGQGVFSFPINSSVTSGIDAINYAYRFYRTDSGYYDMLAQGFLQLGTA